MTQKQEPSRRQPEYLISSARTEPGRGRGRRIGIPTINLSLRDIPDDLPHGIYACRVLIGDTTYDGAMHYGPRPAFRDSETFEVHLIDGAPDEIPLTIDIEVISRLRDVLDFESPEALLKQIERDIAESRAILRGA